MDDDAPTTNFDLIEGHKENIQPIRSGRSARALAASLSPLTSKPHAMRSEHRARQDEFEEELTTAAELDDPLEVWLRYINWTVETFTSGHSADSGLLQLLERATKEFIHDNQYKNDPRYLKLWVQYAQDYSDTPREVYAYLARNEVGQRLALFYEEYAALLESLGRRNQADEIYQMGIDANANPIKRLQRKYDEFLQRMAANPPNDDEPSSPALPTVRPALAAKQLGGLVASGGLGGTPDPQVPPQSAANKPAKMKMAIFSDADAPSAEKSTPARATGGWDNIGTLHHRKKENEIEAKPWAGETLKSHGKAPTTDKLTVFRDTSQMSHITSLSNTMPVPGKRPERIAVVLELVYPPEEEGDEYSFDELRAKSRGLYGIDWNEHRQAAAAERNQRRRPLEGSRTPVKIKTVLSPSPNKGKVRRKGRQTTTAAVSSSPTMTFHTKAATDEIYGIFNQPLKLQPKDPDSQESDGTDFGEESEGDYTTTSMVDTNRTVHQEDDDDDDAASVRSDWSDFNLAQNMAKPSDEDADEGEDEDEDMGEGDTFAVPEPRAPVVKMQKLSIFSDEPGLAKAQQARRLQIPEPPDDFNPPTLPYHIAKDQSHMQSRLPYMTPIVERTESLPGTLGRSRALQPKTPSRGAMPVIDDDDDDEDDDMMGGSPFDEAPRENRRTPLAAIQKQLPLQPKSQLQPVAVVRRREKVLEQGPVVDDKVCNPMDEGMRALIWQKLDPPLKTYDGYYEFPTTNSGRAAEIKRFTKTMAKRDGGGATGGVPENPALEFFVNEGGRQYIVKRELGKGAFAPVYLVENISVADLEEEAEEDGLGKEELERQLAELKLAGRKKYEALKMEHPPNPWEFYIIKQAERRLRNTRAVESIVKAHEMHLFKDEGFLLLEYRDQGTILDLVNHARSEAGGTGVMDELLVMFLTVELLRVTESLHAQLLIHGDIKADNCLVRFDAIADNLWSSRYEPSGSGGWSAKGVTFIDFGRGIDMKLFHPSVQFIADWKTDQQDCAEMRELRPWTFQVDYHGIAAVIHSMLFGKYIQTAAERSGLPGGGHKNYKITTPLKRYWEKPLWAEVFEVLLNPLQEEGGALPITDSLKRCRLKMEAHLVAHCDKGVGLKSMVRKMEVAMSKRR
ncbi:Mad3/BUB1 homology region 1-domain-containing protein [Tricharina praecox]|uniref:Mad3/BUB1 homology region 1-domain-containing protein n=1 Tax=Tricharina praecox TaxID=43433 RepID=UPI00221F7BEA|nr:Mad3/BUB1 homology region 1-domain-containing protein [Tricharina praecox]KAI5846813.1 Mad3/BUB1 homology region 1-domain-containing protein [Tricharina praecox]